MAAQDSSEWKTVKSKRSRRREGGNEPRSHTTARNAVKGKPERAGAVDRGAEASFEELERDYKRYYDAWMASGCRTELVGLLGRIADDLRGHRDVVVEDAGIADRKGNEGAPVTAETQDGQGSSAKDVGEEEDGVRQKSTEANGGTETQRGPDKLTCAVCLGLGSFTPENGGWEARRRAWVQYFAFSTIVEHLSTPVSSPSQSPPTAAEPSSSKIPTYFQDPVFSGAEKSFLASRGHTVLDDPGAFEKLADSREESILVGVHLYLPIYCKALEAGLPRVFVGTGWEIWDEINMGDEVPALKEIHERYRRADFPADEGSTAFSSTSIYWLPRSTSSPAEKEGGTETSEQNSTQETRSP